MKICPNGLKKDLSPHITFTVSDMGLNGKKNGELLQLLLLNKFDVLITFDKNIQHQQNFHKYSVPVLVLNASDNTYLTLKNLAPIL